MLKPNCRGGRKQADSKIVGAGALNTCPSPLSLRDISPHCGESPDSPFFTIIYDFFDKLWAHIVRPFPVRTVDLQNAGDIHASRFSKYNVMLRMIFVGAACGGTPDILCYCKDCQRPSLQNPQPIMGGSYPPLRISVTTVFMAERRGRTLCAPTDVARFK